MIYAIRHGETDWNKFGYIQGGGSNPPLNENGIQQAQQLAPKLENLGIQIIYSSDLLRAYQTAEEINKLLNLQIIKTPLLRETFYGDLEGQLSSITNTNPEYKKICDAVDMGDNDAHFPNGESRNMVVNRMIKFLKNIDKSKNTLLTTHGGMIRSFCVLNHMEDRAIKNCGGIKFDLDENNLPINIKYF